MLMEFVVFIPFSTYFSASKNPFMHPVTADLEDSGFLADSESPPEVGNKRHLKRSRVRPIKQNDSVSGNYWSCSPGLFVLPDQDGGLAPVPPGRS